MENIHYFFMEMLGQLEYSLYLCLDNKARKYFMHQY